MKVSQDAFAVSRRYIMEKGRQLERARFKFHFEGGPASLVVAALAHYQNEDGGFGHALEPDLRTPNSSAICTTVAFRVFRETGITDEETMVARAIDHLQRTVDGHRWRIVPLSAGQEPHAPWYQQQDLDTAFRRFVLNPTAEILGYLYDYPGQVDSSLIQTLCEQVLQTLHAMDELEMHELLCCVRLLESKTMPLDVRRQVEQALTPFVDTVVAWNPEQWSGYNLRPLDVIRTPDSPYMAGREDAVAANLDDTVASRTAAGTWLPTWSWYGSFPDAWTAAQEEWTSVCTLEALLTLKRHGRLSE